MKISIILLTLLCTAVFAQQKGTFTDARDGKTYKTVNIGKQTWMAENLDYYGEDGYLGLCYGEKIRKPENCKKYGRLYYWNEAMETCPKGWHLPDTTEWNELINFAGGIYVAGKKLKARTGWKGHDFTYTTDEFDFSALPGGNGILDGDFQTAGDGGYWWSSSELGRRGSDYAYYMFMFYNYNKALLNHCHKHFLRSVRCVMD